MVFIGIVLLIISVFKIFLQKKISITAGSILLVGVILISFSITNTITSRKQVILPKETLEKISKINWCDNNNLEKIGFEKSEFGYAFRDKFSLRIEKSNETPKHTLKYKNFSYDFSETRLGLLDIKRLLGKTNVTRNYYIYIDDSKIYMFEDVKENSPYVFEEIINKIHKIQQQNTVNNTGDGSPE